MTSTNKKYASAALVIAAIVFTAAVLRAPLLAVGALSGEIQEATGLAAGLVGFLTTIPMLAFAALSVITGAASHAIGNVRTLFIGCMLVTVGLAVRSFCGDFGLFIGTVLLGVGICVGNVLLPAVVKERFPNSIGALTALYTTVMAVFAGTAAGTGTLLSESGLGWQATLALWLPFAAVGAGLWLVVRAMTKSTEGTEEFDAATTARARLLDKRLLKNPLTWHVGCYMGFQSFVFYCCIAWLPTILSAQGMDQTSVRLCIAVFPLISIPVNLLLPNLASRLKDQRLMAALAGAFVAVGVLMLLAVDSPLTGAITVVVLGLALGSSYCLSMLFFGIRTRNSKDAASLSGIAQSFGYLLASIGPTLTGALVDATGSWIVPIVLLSIVALTLVFFGWKSGDGVV